MAHLAADSKQQGVRGQTIAETLSVLFGCLREAKRRGAIATDRERMGRDERPPRHKRILSAGEIAQVLSGAFATFRPLIAGMLSAASASGGGPGPPLAGRRLRRELHPRAVPARPYAPARRAGADFLFTSDGRGRGRDHRLHRARH